jgi:hypothetical protein
VDIREQCQYNEIEFAKACSKTRSPAKSTSRPCNDWSQEDQTIANIAYILASVYGFFRETLSLSVNHVGDGLPCWQGHRWYSSLDTHRSTIEKRLPLANHMTLGK